MFTIDDTPYQLQRASRLGGVSLKLLSDGKEIDKLFWNTSKARHVSSNGVLTLWFSDTHVYVDGPNIIISPLKNKYFSCITNDISGDLKKAASEGKVLKIGSSADYESLFYSRVKSRRVSIDKGSRIKSNISHLPFAFSSFIDSPPLFGISGGKCCFEDWLSASIEREIDSFYNSSNKLFVFSVNQDGNVEDVECSFDSSIKRGYYEETMESDILIMNIIHNSPQWTPAKINGESISTKLYVEIMFEGNGIHPVITLYR